MENKTVQIMGRELTVRKDAYVCNGALAVSLWTEAGEPFCTLSVNCPDVVLADSEFVAKNYSELKQFYPRILASGIIEETGRTVAVSDFVSAPICKLASE